MASQPNSGTVHLDGSLKRAIWRTVHNREQHMEEVPATLGNQASKDVVAL